MSKLLEQLVRESRKDLGAPEVDRVDWDRVDRKIFARIEAERRAEGSGLGGVAPGRGKLWALAATALAAAAAVALVVGKAHETAGSGPLVVSSVPAAGTVVAIGSGGELLVDGKLVAAGAVVHLGDVIEARGAVSTLERPGKLTWVLEPGTMASITHVQGALVLGLARGAVEAQVVPVVSGEAFAVDVDGSRVAVHGTHLRVEKVGDHVAVDLGEGVVVVGPSPRVGSTIGELVTAPAHAEFAPADPKILLTVSHEASMLRPAVAMGAASGSAAPQGPSVAVVAPASPRVDARPPPVSLRPQQATSVATAQQVPPQPPAPAAPQADPNAAGVVGSAVRACMAARTGPENVTVVVSTTLHLDLDGDGNVRAARFDPPVAPDVNACAAPAIYRARFTHDGSADIPVDFTVRAPDR